MYREQGADRKWRETARIIFAEFAIDDINTHVCLIVKQGLPNFKRLCAF